MSFQQSAWFLGKVRWICGQFVRKLLLSAPCLPLRDRLPRYGGEVALAPEGAKEGQFGSSNSSTRQPPSVGMRRTGFANASVGM